MKKSVIDGLKMSAAIVAFVIVYGLADWLGGNMPFWIGIALLLGGVAALIAVAVKIAKDGL